MALDVRGLTVRNVACNGGRAAPPQNRRHSAKSADRSGFVTFARSASFGSGHGGQCCRYRRGEHVLTPPRLLLDGALAIESSKSAAGELG